jgi:hypothetical protein
MRKDYRICDLEAYINWMYFFHAWSLPSNSKEGIQLQQEAREMLHQLQPHLTIKTVVEVLPAYSDGDDIVVLRPTLCECGQVHSAAEIRIPMLRQQIPNNDGSCLCLSDFIRPKSATIQDKIGIFAASVSILGLLTPVTTMYTGEYAERRFLVSLITSIPSNLGRSMSRITASGLVCSISLTASYPSEQSPTTW